MNELVFESEQTCPYLHDRVARLPLRLQLLPLRAEDFDLMLSQGNRRTGRYLYKTACPTCRECVPIRVPVASFRPSRGQRRVWNRGERLIETRIAAPQVDEQRVRLFNAHRNQRGMNLHDSPFDASDYAESWLDSCCDSVAFDYFVDGQLVAVAICDRGVKSWSAVYCFFDPAFSHLSLGTYSVLKQIDTGRRHGIEWLYLGFLIENCGHMRYKSIFRPHELRVDGQWRAYDPGGSGAGISDSGS